MFTYKTGDMFVNEPTGTLVITVNCEGVMGKGIAFWAKKNDPKCFEAYKAICDRGEMKPGQPHLVCEGRYLLAPTKDQWRYPSKYEWIAEILDRVAKNADKLEKIVFPPLGCANGQLDWTAVHQMIVDRLGQLARVNTLEVVIYPPQPAFDQARKNGNGNGNGK